MSYQTRVPDQRYQEQESPTARKRFKDAGTDNANESMAMGQIHDDIDYFKRINLISLLIHDKEKALDRKNKEGRERKEELRPHLGSDQERPQCYRLTLLKHTKNVNRNIQAVN